MPGSTGACRVQRPPEAAGMEERDFPRREYWDRLGTSTKSLKIHFRDHSKLSGFTKTLLQI